LTRLEEIEDTARWQAAINYLRGRALEAQRDYDSAIDALNNEDSEQFHGNLIRVRLLKKITGATGNQARDKDEKDEVEPKEGSKEPNKPKADEKNDGGTEQPAEQPALEPETDSPESEETNENSDDGSESN
jgi:Mn-containing catalase